MTMKMGKYKPPKGQPRSYSAPVSIPSSPASSREPSPEVRTKTRVKKMAMPTGAKIGIGVMGALGMLGAGYGLGYYNNRGGLGNNLANKVPFPSPTPKPTPTPTPTPTPVPTRTPPPYFTPVPGGQIGYSNIVGYRNPAAA